MNIAIFRFESMVLMRTLRKCDFTDVMKWDSLIGIYVFFTFLTVLEKLRICHRHLGTHSVGYGVYFGSIL